MPGVALFVDHENIFIGLKELVGLRSPDRSDPAAKAAYQSHNQMLAATLASGLRREAEKLGPLRLAYAVANFSQYDFFHHPGIYAQFGFEPRYNVAGRNSADTFITNLVNEVLADPRYTDLDTYVLASGDGGYFYVVQKLVDQQRQVRIWGVSGHTSRLMEGLGAVAVTVDYIDQMVDITPVKVAAGAAARPLRAPSQAEAAGNRAGNDTAPATGAAASAPAPSAAGAAATGAARRAVADAAVRAPHGLSDMQVLAALFDEYLAAERLDFLSPRLFLEFLDRNRVGGPEESSRARYLQEALQIGVVKEEKVWLGDREGLRILLNESSEVVSRYRLILRNLFGPSLAKPLHPTDSFRPKRSFVVFSIVRAVAGLEPDEVHRWLDWFVLRGMLTSTYEKLPKDAQAANILKMNPEHRMVQALLAGMMWDRIATPLLVLAVDDLLRTPPRPWVALSLLLRRIGEALPVSREDLRAAVGQALDQGLLVKKEYPNPRRPEPTSGVHLGEVPQVVEALATARSFIGRVVELARPTGQVPISYLIQQCAAAGLCEGEFDRVKDWITVLEKAGLLLLRTVAHPALAGQTMTVVSPDGARCQALLSAAAAEPAAVAEPPADQAG